MRRLYTYGYDSIPIRAVLDYLGRKGVRHVVDVRFQPFSRNPSYRREALRRALEAAGLRYTHEPGLGNVNYKGGPMALADPTKLEALRRMVETEEGVCILCVCSRADTCHRRLVSDTLQSMMDLEVVDL